MPTRYPHIDPYAAGMLAVTDGHERCDDDILVHQLSSADTKSHGTRYDLLEELGRRPSCRVQCRQRREKVLAQRGVTKRKRAIRRWADRTNAP